MSRKSFDFVKAISVLNAAIAQIRTEIDESDRPQLSALELETVRQFERGLNPEQIFEFWLNETHPMTLDRRWNDLRLAKRLGRLGINVDSDEMTYFDAYRRESESFSRFQALKQLRGNRA